MINLKRFTKEILTVAPVINNSFKFNRKYYKIEGTKVSDNWYRVSISGNKVTIIEQAIIELENVTFSTINGYCYNNQIVFQNFDVAKRKLHKEIISPLYLNRSQNFTAVNAIIWEESELIYYKLNYRDTMVNEIRNIFSNGAQITNIKGVTPELQTLFLFNTLEDERYKTDLLEDKSFFSTGKSSISYKDLLHKSFINAGANLIHYSIQGKNCIVEWSIKGFSSSIISVLDVDTFKVKHAGFCMEGDDYRHNVTSLLATAKLFNESDDIVLMN